MKGSWSLFLFMETQKKNTRISQQDSGIHQALLKLAHWLLGDMRKDACRDNLSPGLQQMLCLPDQKGTTIFQLHPGEMQSMSWSFGHPRRSSRLPPHHFHLLFLLFLKAKPWSIELSCWEGFMGCREVNNHSKPVLSLNVEKIQRGYPAHILKCGQRRGFFCGFHVVSKSRFG